MITALKAELKAALEAAAAAVEPPITNLVVETKLAEKDRLNAPPFVVLSAGRGSLEQDGTKVRRGTQQYLTRHFGWKQDIVVVLVGSDQEQVDLLLAEFLIQIETNRFHDSAGHYLDLSTVSVLAEEEESLIRERFMISLVMTYEGGVYSETDTVEITSVGATPGVKP